MPDLSKTKAKRRAREAEAARKVKEANKNLELHDQHSRDLLLPEEYMQVADRDSFFTQSKLTVYRKPRTSDDPPKFVLRLNDRLLGPFTLNELQCLKECLIHDLELK